MSTINSDGKVAYIYNSGDDTWYALGGAVNTNAEYTWTADQSFSAVVTLDSVVSAKAGVNNFQDPTARDAAIPSPINGTVCFVKQKNDGVIINQVQYYYNGEWRYALDSMTAVDITSDYTITKDDAGKTLFITSSSPVTITIPANSTTAFAKGQRVEFIRNGTGAVTFAGEVTVVGQPSPVTINSKLSNKKIAAQYSGAVVTKKDTNTWLLLGDLTA
jgi:hypothetical protein